MPELPEVETLARKLRPDLIGKRIITVEVLWPRTVDRPAPARFCQELKGASFTDVSRRGKYLLMSLDIGKVLLVHLRMSGRFTICPPGEALPDSRHSRVIFELAGATRLIYVDPRKFGRFYLVRDAEEIVEGLGPEPLAAGFTVPDLKARLSERRGEIKRLLLDQHFVAGLGNIYASEVLWQARIHPARGADTLSPEACNRLHHAIVHVLRQAIRHGGTSLDDRQYVYPDGGLGAHQRHLAVYDRAEAPCLRCGKPVARMVQGQRATYYCPICQPLMTEDKGADG